MNIPTITAMNAPENSSLCFSDNSIVTTFATVITTMEFTTISTVSNTRFLYSIFFNPY